MTLIVSASYVCVGPYFSPCESLMSYEKRIIHLLNNIFVPLESLFGQCDSWQMNGKEKKSPPQSISNDDIDVDDEE